MAKALWCCFLLDSLPRPSPEISVLELPSFSSQFFVRALLPSSASEILNTGYDTRTYRTQLMATLSQPRFNTYLSTLTDNEMQSLTESTWLVMHLRCTSLRPTAYAYTIFRIEPTMLSIEVHPTGYHIGRRIEFGGPLLQHT